MIDPGIPSFRTADWKFRLIDGRYRVASILARTDTTAVLVADDGEGVERVLKVVRHGGDDARFLQIIREFDIMRSIEHPGVVRAQRVFELDEEHAAIVMNRAPGRNLQTLMRSRQSLDVEVAVDITRGAARALAAVHAAGWLHRDVKPANLVVDITGARPRVTLVDFGIAGPNTNFAPQWFSGTPAYASPEQMKGEPLDVRSDLYSLGATLYFALAGRPPYMFDDLLQRFRGPGLQPPESLTEATGAPFPTDLEHLVARMLAHNREDRPRDFAELGMLLDELRGTSICFSGAKITTSANDAPTVMVSTTDETLQEIPLQALMEVYVDAILEDPALASSEFGLTVWGSASARRRRPFTIDGTGVVYAADQRCVVSTDRAGRPRDLHRAGRDGADISALAWSRDAVWSGTTDGHLVVVTEDECWESGLPQPCPVVEIATDEAGSVALVRSANGMVSLCRDHGKRWWGEVAHDARAVAVSRDGTRFACATRRGVEVGWIYDNAWEPAEIINTPAAVTSLAFLAGGELAVGDEDAAIWVYGSAGRNPRSHFLLPLEGPIELTSSGEHLFACSCDDHGHILVRDVSPGEAAGWVHFS